MKKLLLAVALLPFLGRASSLLADPATNPPPPPPAHAPLYRERVFCLRANGEENLSTIIERAPQDLKQNPDANLTCDDPRPIIKIRQKLQFQVVNWSQSNWDALFLVVDKFSSGSRILKIEQTVEQDHALPKGASKYYARFEGTKISPKGQVGLIVFKKDVDLKIGRVKVPQVGMRFIDAMTDCRVSTTTDTLVGGPPAPAPMINIKDMQIVTDAGTGNKVAQEYVKNTPLCDDPLHNGKDSTGLFPDANRFREKGVFTGYNVTYITVTVEHVMTLEYYLAKPSGLTRFQFNWIAAEWNDDKKKYLAKLPPPPDSNSYNFGLFRVSSVGALPHLVANSSLSDTEAFEKYMYLAPTANKRPLYKLQVNKEIDADFQSGTRFAPRRDCVEPALQDLSVSDPGCFETKSDICSSDFSPATGCLSAGVSMDLQSISEEYFVPSNSRISDDLASQVKHWRTRKGSLRHEIDANGKNLAGDTYQRRSARWSAVAIPAAFSFVNGVSLEDAGLDIFTPQGMNQTQGGKGPCSDGCKSQNCGDFPKDPPPQRLSLVVQNPLSTTGGTITTVPSTSMSTSMSTMTTIPSTSMWTSSTFMPTPVPTMTTVTSSTFQINAISSTITTPSISVPTTPKVVATPQ